MIGVIPNSIKVPLLLAIIILSQYRGSEVSVVHQSFVHERGALASRTR